MFVKSINIILQKIIRQTIAYIKNFMYLCDVKRNKEQTKLIRRYNYESKQNWLQ